MSYPVNNRLLQNTMGKLSTNGGFLSDQNFMFDNSTQEASMSNSLAFKMNL